MTADAVTLTDDDVLALMRLLAPVVERCRHYGLKIEDAEVYARTVLAAGYVPADRLAAVQAERDRIAQINEENWAKLGGYVEAWGPLLARAESAERRLAEVEALHPRLTLTGHLANLGSPDTCGTCWDGSRPGYAIWPCPTIAALVAATAPGNRDGEPPVSVHADAFCADCESLMVEDDGAGHLCPVCDLHDDCEDFPCGGYDDTPCVLNAPLGSRADALTTEGDQP